MPTRKLNDKIKQAYCEWLTEVIRNFDMSDIDGFLDEQEIGSEWEIGALLALPVKVVIDE